METNQVRYFLALCEEKNFTRAARRCGVSQPSVSNAIKRLEEELGGDLFHRTKNGQSYRLLVWPSDHILIRSTSVQKVSNARPRIFQQPTWPQSRHERAFLPKIFYVIAIPVCILFDGVLFQPASRSLANTLDVGALEATIDIKHMPRQDLPSETYQ